VRLRRPLIALAGLAATALTLTACASGTAEEPTAAPDAAVGTGFPVTIEHAFGETVVESAPARVATWGWGSTEAAISVGVYPVAVGEQSWTVGEGNLLPWVESAYDEAGVEHPVVLNDDEGGASVPYEEFIEAAPDLIVAPYSGLTEEQYDTLSDIAPVVAYPDAPWSTPWDENIEITARSLGLEAEGRAVLDEIDAYLADEAAAHPEFEGKTLAGIWDGDGVVSVYTGADPRIQVLTELGLEVAPSVAELDSSDGGFYYDLSYEQLDKLDSDLVVNYSNSQEAAEALLTKPETQAIPAVAAGRVAQVYDPITVSSVSPPTALSFTWKDGMPALIESIAGALAE
jgi:iron complex transport system substrate-binding protein